MLTLRFAARSDVGRVRKNNEDSGYASANLLIVADGMGGHAAGELASAATVAAMVASVNPASSADEVLAQLTEAVNTASEHIADVVAGNRELNGMGTTLTALTLSNDRVALAHVGDSRAYRFAEGQVQQLTKDHTFVQTLVDAGQITPEEAAVHPRRNLMMRAIDGIHAVEADLSVREAQVGDRYLLCSDGLCGVVPPETIADCLLIEDLPACVTALIDAARSFGAPDNVTAIVADVVSDDEPAESVLIGAAAERGNRKRLPSVIFPIDIQRLPQRKRPRWLIPAATAAITALLVLGFGGWWVSQQWYVGPDAATGKVALYQGIPVRALNHAAVISETRVNALPEYEKGQVEATLSVDSQADGLAALDRLAGRAAACALQPETPGCP